MSRIFNQVQKTGKSQKLCRQADEEDKTLLNIKCGMDLHQTTYIGRYVLKQTEANSSDMIKSWKCDLFLWFHLKVQISRDLGAEMNHNIGKNLI